MGGPGPGTYTDEEPYPEDTNPTVCESRDVPARAIAQNDECYSEGPTVGSFTPIVEWTKDTFREDPTSNNVMMLPAVGSLTDADDAETVVSMGGQVRLQDRDGTVLCTNRIPGADSAYYGGPPTVADFDGDAELACAAGSRYSVF